MPMTLIHTPASFPDGVKYLKGGALWEAGLLEMRACPAHCCGRGRGATAVGAARVRKAEKFETRTSLPPVARCPAERTCNLTSANSNATCDDEHAAYLASASDFLRAVWMCSS